MSNRRYAIYLPNCALCPSHQANFSHHLKQTTQWTKLLKKTLLMYDQIDFIQMPCPEVSFCYSLDPMPRKPHGIKYYASLEGFDTYCDQLVEQMITETNILKKAGVEILCVVGVEHSPTCATKYMRTNKGTEHREGIFMEKIKKRLSNEKIFPAFIGINRRFPEKAIKEINKLLESSLEV